jgi:hypothetical protein
MNMFQLIFQPLCGVLSELRLLSLFSFIFKCKISMSSLANKTLLMKALIACFNLVGLTVTLNFQHKFLKYIDLA